MKELNCCLLFLVKEDKVLLAMKKAGFGAGRYNGVGGKAEPGETIEQTMLREAQEEINVKPTKYEKAVRIAFDEYFKGEPAILTVFVYIATDWIGEPTETDEMAPAWFRKDQLPLDKMWNDDQYWLAEALAGKKMLAKFKLDKNDQVIEKDITFVSEFKEWTI